MNGQRVNIELITTTNLSESNNSVCLKLLNFTFSCYIGDQVEVILEIVDCYALRITVLI